MSVLALGGLQRTCQVRMLGTRVVAGHQSAVFACDFRTTPLTSFPF